MSKQNSTAIAVILDKSGSMLSSVQATIDGFNSFLETQKSLPGEASLTMVLFDTIYKVMAVDKPLNDVEPLNAFTYIPGGGTALNDAVARTITELGHKLSAKPEAERPSKVLAVIITDGEENASKEYPGVGNTAITAMIKHQEEKYSWEFLYIGAGLRALEQARSMGIKPENAARYLVGSEHEVFKSSSSAVERGRRGMSVGYSIGERSSMLDPSKK